MAHTSRGLDFLECGNSTADMEIRMRNNVCTLILAGASLAPSALLAQALEPAGGGATIIATAPGKGVAERVAQITASVEAVDTAKRTVTLKGPTGDIITLAVGPVEAAGEPQ